MAENTISLGKMVLSGLVDLKAKKGRITLEDVGVMFLEMSSEYHRKQSEHDQFMHEEISRLAAYIDEANREILAISTDDKSDAAITDASLHLDEVVKATEQATNAIMDAADVIQQAAGGIGGEKETAILDAANRIYDACNFQDITGQRVNKVIKLLSNIESRVGKLNSSLSTVVSDEAKVAPVLVKNDDKALLNGPALPAHAASQEEIDKLFASLGGN